MHGTVSLSKRLAQKISPSLGSVMFLLLAKLVTSRHLIIYVAEVVDQCIKFVVKTVVSIMGKTVAKIVVKVFVLN